MARPTLPVLLDRLAAARDAVPRVARFARDAAAIARSAQAVLDEVAAFADRVAPPRRVVFTRDPKTGTYVPTEEPR